MKKGRILHLEDHPEWIEHVREVLSTDYDLYSAGTEEEAAQLFYDLNKDGLKIDLAIIDISLVLHDAHDKQGFHFIEALENSGVMLGDNIIVLTGYAEIDENLRVAFRDYHVVDVFDKGNFVDEKNAFKQKIEEIIRDLQKLPNL